MLEYDPPALTFLPGGEDGNVEVQMFNATAMQEQAAHDLGTLGLTETRAPGEIDEALLKYHQHIVLPRLVKHVELSEYLEEFINDLMQRLREAELLRDESPKTQTARLHQRLNRLESNIDMLQNDVGRLRAELERLRVPQQPRNQHQSTEERIKGAQYAAYQLRGSSRRAPSLDGSIRSGEDNGLPVSAEVLYDAVCRSLLEGRARRSNPPSEAAESDTPWTPGSVYYNLPDNLLPCNDSFW